MKRNERILRAEGKVDPDFYFGRGAGSLLYHQPFKTLGSWMNSGFHKEFLFSMIRHGVEAAGYDCVIFASDMFRFQGNAMYLKLPEEEQHRLTDRGFKKLASLGYGTTVEAVSVIGQTPERVTFISKAYYRDVLNPDKVFRIDTKSERGTMPIEDYGGRSKMWGDWGEPGMPEAYEVVRKILATHGPPIKEVLEASVTLVNIAVDEP